MELSKFRKKILKSVKSARSLAFRPPIKNRPQVPARAAAAAAAARALSSLSPLQSLSLCPSSDPLNTIYGGIVRGQPVEEVEPEFFEEEFDAIRHILKHIPDGDDELEYLQMKATLRLLQIDSITDRLSHHITEHHEEMVRAMHLVRELERDLKIAIIICMNGRRHLTSSMNEVSRDLIVTSNSKKKQVLLEMIPILTELRHALEMQKALEVHVDEGNYSKAFQVLSEYLQVLDSFSELSAVQEMSRDVEVWLGKTLQKLDSLLVQVCVEFKEESYITVIDAYALIGDIPGLAEKIQGFFMRSILSETHCILKIAVQEDEYYSDDSQASLNSRLTYNDLCPLIPEPKFRICLLRTLSVLFKTMSSYHSIMSCEAEKKIMDVDQKQDDSSLSNGENQTEAVTGISPWYELRRDSTTLVSGTLQKGCKNLWQHIASRVSALLSSAAFSSTSIHKFLKNYEDLYVFILAGEAFCGVEASEFRSKLKSACESYFASFHRQNMHALKMVLEKENWQILPQDVIQTLSFAGLFGDGAPLLRSSDVKSAQYCHPINMLNSSGFRTNKNAFSQWIDNGDPFLAKLASSSGEYETLAFLETPEESKYMIETDEVSSQNSDANHMNSKMINEDENEDLLADFIDEDSQQPSHSKPIISRQQSLQWRENEAASQTGSSLCLLRFMDKYARLMLKLELANVKLFKGMCQFFEVYYYYTYEIFGQQNGSPNGTGADSVNCRLKTTLSQIAQDCDQWLKPQLTQDSSTPSTPTNAPEVTPTNPPHSLNTSFGLQERCAATAALCHVAQLLHRSKSHLQSMLLQNNAAIVEDFFVNLVDSVPALVEHIHRITTAMFLNVNGYVERIANSKWELKELGMENNCHIDLLLGEFKQYKQRLAQGGIQKEVQVTLQDYGVEMVAQMLVEGLSRVKKCTNEGRALMSLDLQVLINGLRQLDLKDVKQKLQIVESFIKAYYLPETEYVEWARAHPEYTKSQVVGLVNLVATMKGWKRKTKAEVLEKIESW